MFVRKESLRQYIRLYPIISTLIIVHLSVYLLLTLPMFPNQLLFEKFAGVNLYISNGEWWRIVTPIFMHTSFIHLLFNSFTCIIFAPPLEHLLGKNRFLFLYISAGVFANIATFFLEPLTYVHIGSSGAIFGLFGFLLFLAIFKKYLLSKDHAQMIIIIGILALVFSLTEVNVNVVAHIAGMLFGVIYGFIVLKNKK